MTERQKRGRKPAEGPTLREGACLEFVRSYRAKNGYCPTNTEITAHFGWRSTANARFVIARLIAKGYLERGVFRSGRALRITSKSHPVAFPAAEGQVSWDARRVWDGVEVRVPDRLLSIKEARELSLELEILAEEIEEAEAREAS